jgi:hypothetical protein
MKSDYVDAYWKRALAKTRVDSMQSAIADFDKVIELKPSGEAFYQRANAKWILKDSGGACVDWNDACDMQINRACDMMRNNCKR